MRTKLRKPYLLLFFLFPAFTLYAQQACDCTLPAVQLSLSCSNYCNALGTNTALPDTTKIPGRSMPQHTAFEDGSYNYPAKPRNQWELGLKVGTANIVGDITSVFPGKAIGVHLRKSLGHTFSIRAEYTYGIAYGLSTDRETNYSQNPAWQGYNGRRVFYNYKTTFNDIALEGVVSIDNIRFHKSKLRIIPYALAGFGLTTYQSKINTRNSDGSLYDFQSIPANYSYAIRKEVLKKLKNLFDDTYETPAETDGNLRPKFLGVTALRVAHLGAGFAFKLNDRLNVAAEERLSITNSDLLDGKQWAPQPPRNPVYTRSYDIYNYLTLGLNVNLGAKSVVPQWWSNPLQYAYSELRNPMLMRLPKIVLPDADEDGVTDQFDLEQTPKGVPVDGRGVSRDTDGDGVPDALDKELMTPTLCQPVDANGIGKCPCPEDCGGQQ